jgi:hypothetical protein
VYEMGDLQELMAKQEELDDELLPYLEEEGPLGGHQCLRHPLVYSVLHHPQLNALMNETLRAKKAALKDYAARKEWHNFVFAHERPYRIEAFTHICWQLRDKEYWRLLGTIYTDSENVYQNQDDWRECLTAERRHRDHMMRPDEREALAHDIDAENGTVYRGFHMDGGEAGLSWTTNSIVAGYFARRLAGHDVPRVATGKVDRKDILAFFDGRSEYECVILPENVRDITIKEVHR